MSANARGEPASVLVVEDDAVVAAHMQQVLQGMGYRVAGLAATGEEAVRCACEREVDVVLMDVRLRGGLSGVEAASQIRSLKDIPVIYVTAYADDPLIQEAKRAYPAAYLIKPVRDRELYAAIEMALFRRGVERRASRMAHVLRAMRDATVVLAREPGPEGMERICAILGTVEGWGVVGLCWREEGEFCAVAAGRLAALRDALPRDEAVCRVLWEMGAGGPRVWHDPASLPPPLAGLADDAGLKALVTVPLGLDEAARGVLWVGVDRTEEVYEEEVQLLGELATDMAFALGAAEHARARREAESLQQQTQRQYRDLVEHLEDVVLQLDASGSIAFANTALRTLTGRDPREVVGCPLASLFPPEAASEIASALQRCGGGVPVRAEYQVSSADGKKKWVRMVARLMTEENRGFLVTLHDLTQERLLEEQLRRSQRLESLGQLAGGIAHDFNNVLQAIVGYLSLAMRHVAPESEAYHDLKEIEQAATRATTLTRQLLAFSRRQSMELKVQDLNEILVSLLKMLRRVLGEHIELEFVPGAIPPVKADTGQVEQVLLNLALNARDAMPGGGKLTIRTTVCPEGASPLAGEAVVMQVQDTGVGMDEEVLQRAFEPFFTTKGSKGNGLGLSMVYGIVKQHGGHVELSSTPGLGTTVTVYLPVCRETVQPSAMESPWAAGRGGGTVLLAEDEEAIRNLNARILSAAGYRVIQAADGDAVLRVLEEAGGEIDVVVLDVVMPKRGGLEVYRHMEERRMGIPVVFCSGYSEELVDTDLIAAKGLCLLRKPFSPTQLISAVGQALADRSRQRA